MPDSHKPPISAVAPLAVKEIQDTDGRRTVFRSAEEMLKLMTANRSDETAGELFSVDCGFSRGYR